MFTKRIAVFKQTLASFEADNTDCHDTLLETFRKVESVYCMAIHESPVIALLVFLHQMGLPRLTGPVRRQISQFCSSFQSQNMVQIR